MDIISILTDPIKAGLAVNLLPLVLWLLMKTPLQNWTVSALSWVLNWYLSNRYAVHHIEDKSALPGCQYQWPNGQGDEAKFKSGKENSEQWGEEYGGIYRIWSGSTPEIVLTKPEHIKVVFKDSNKHQKAVDNNSGYLMSKILGQCVGLISGDKWARVRSVSEKPFVRSAVPSYVSMINARTKRHFRELVDEGKLRDGTIHPAEDMKLLAFWIIAEIIYGPLDADMENRLLALIPLRENLFKYVIAGGLPRFSWSKYLPLQANRELRNFRAKWHEFNKYARARAEREGSGALIIHLFDAVARGEITSEQMYHTVDEALYANLDVTLGALSWNLVFLGAHKDIQARVRAEITERREMAEIDETVMNAYFMSTTTLLSACMDESSRLRPLAAFSVPQSAPTPREIDGYVFPAGTNFIVDAYALNIRNSFWGDDSDQYRPDRFFKVKGTEARYNFWRFGFGPRQCMGKYVADTLIRAILVHLVENYELGSMDSEWKRDEEVWINHPDFRVACSPRNKYGLSDLNSSA
ncbi:Cytochrome P450 [Aspergillus sclerotialis]|uniref:Cytochrome P450 n=1 Tax=Aspergillus sclerotialis TaxID=2070753 RepID=A0A3A3A5Z1_9EURO|nr:Cytochrome P450 [Aspergillus sclerotialis]